MVAGGGVMSDIYSYGEMPWHGKAFVSDREMGAVEAASVIENVFYEKRPVMVMVNGQLQEVSDFAIVRSPIPSDPQEQILGFVKKNYKILQPLDICQSFDEFVGAPVETLGFLGQKGEKLFLTWKLPGFDVNGDEVILFGFVACGYDGKFGATLYVVTVRVVCKNTFSVAVLEGENPDNQKDGRGKIWSGRHNSKNLSNDLGAWMEHVQGRAVAKSAGIQTMFQNMAATKIEDSKTLADLLFKIYPDPKKLPDDYPDRIRASKELAIEQAMIKAQHDREMVAGLFGGNGIAITPDAWGLMNSVTEYENHVRMTKKPAEYSIIMGNRANTMTNAANVLNAFVALSK